MKKHVLLLILLLGLVLFTSCGNTLEATFYLSRAESAYNSGEYEEAIKYYDKVIALDQRLDKAYTGKADSFEALGKHEQSLELCEKAIQANSNMHKAYNVKGDALSSLGKYEESLECYKKAAQLDPNESLYQNNIAFSFNNLEKYDEALEHSEKAIELNANNDMAYVNKGYALESQGKIDEAIKCYEKSAQINPSNSIAYYNKGYLLDSMGNSEEAIKLFDKALEVDPDDLDALNAKGDSLNSLGEYEEAIKCFDLVLKKDSQNAYAYVSKSISLYGLGKYSDSMEACDKALNIDSNYVNAYTWKAKNYMQQDDFEKARELCDKSISIDNNSFAYDIKGLSYVYEGDYIEAMKYFDKAIELDPSFDDPYIHKIYSLYQQKNFQECIAFSDKAAAIFPDCEDIPWYAADCYSTQLESEKALEYYERVLKINPENLSVLTSIGWECYYLQDYEKASDYVEKAMKVSPDDENVLSLKASLDKQKLPEAERVVDFVKNNYLYYDKVKDFDKISDQFKAKGEVSVHDISQFIDKVRVKNDMFTFVIHGDDYDLLKYEESTSQVVSKELDSNIHYIKINSFTASVSWDFKKVIDEIKNPEDKVLVIDLKDNTGGLTSSSTDILDFLLPACTTSYIVYRDGYIYSYYSDDSQIKFKKILVLVNEYSASSSEILALGLKKYLNNVVIIGHPTVGKGVGQIVYEDKAKKYVIYLVSFYWNVMEKNIMGEKIHPDIYVKGASDASYMKEIYRQASK